MRSRAVAARVILVIAVALGSGELYARYGSTDFSDGGLFKPIADAGAELSRFGDLPMGETAAGDPRWFADEPSPPPATAATTFPELDGRASDPSILNVTGLNFPRVYNHAFVTQAVCADRKHSFFSRLPHRLFTFEPRAGEVDPMFRFYPNSRYPSGLRTNHLGYRGPDISADRDVDVVRVAFLGASTVIGHPRAPFASPDFVMTWLARWARERGLGVRFDYVNAAREGVAVRQITEILNREVAPLKPDIVILWGAETFDFGSFVKLPPGVVIGQPPKTDMVSRATAAIGASGLAERSALIRLLSARSRRPFDDQGIAREPSKPGYERAFPSDFTAPSPQLGPDVPAPMATAYKDLSGFIDAVGAIGAIPILMANQYAAHDGALITADRSTRDPILDATFGGVYGYLNGARWPITYADQRAILEYETRLFKELARQRGVTFIDLLSSRVLDTGLFLDGAHLTPLGMKLTGWWMFQELVPAIESYVKARQPRDSRTNPADLAYLEQAPHELDIATVDCSPQHPSDEVPGAYPLEGMVAADRDVTIVAGATAAFTTSLNPDGYAAAIPITSTAQAGLSGKGWVGVRLRLTTGRVSVGVLNRTESKFLNSLIVEADGAEQEVYIMLDDLSEVGKLMISNARNGEKARSAGEVHRVVLRRFR